MLRFRWEYEDKRRFQVLDEDATDRYRDVELAIWAEAWRTPQAAAWVLQEWRWPIIAEYCRLKTIVESEPDSNASLVAQLHRYRDQIGLTPAGLKENGWQIGDATPEPKAATTGAKQPKKGGSRARLGVIQGGAAG